MIVGQAAWNELFHPSSVVSAVAHNGHHRRKVLARATTIAPVRSANAEAPPVQKLPTIARMVNVMDRYDEWRIPAHKRDHGKKPYQTESRRNGRRAKRAFFFFLLEHEEMGAAPLFAPC
jgi:hypothetical protein